MSTKRKIDVTDYANTIVKALPKGILFTTKAADKVNTMVIGWGALGVNWSRPMFTAYIREHRFTAEQIAKNPEFTVNVPLEGADPAVTRVCGSNHGDAIDKIAEASLTPVEPNVVSVPGFAEYPLTLECKIVYARLQDKEKYPADILESLYPQDVDGSATGANRDAHITVYGEIVDAYIIED